MSAADGGGLIRDQAELARIVLLQGIEIPGDDEIRTHGDYLWGELNKSGSRAAATATSPTKDIEFNTTIKIDERDRAQATRWLQPSTDRSGIDWVRGAEWKDDGSVNLQIDVPKLISYLQRNNSLTPQSRNLQAKIIQAIFTNLATDELERVLPILAELSKATGTIDPEIKLLCDFSEAYTKFSVQKDELMRQPMPVPAASYMETPQEIRDRDILHAAIDAFQSMFDAHDIYPDSTPAARKGGGIFKSLVSFSSMKTMTPPSSVVRYEKAKEAVRAKLTEILLVDPDIILGLVAQKYLTEHKLEQLRRSPDPNLAIAIAVERAIQELIQPQPGQELGLIQELEHAADAVVNDKNVKAYNAEFYDKLQSQQKERMVALQAGAPGERRGGGRASLAAMVHRPAPVTNRSSVAVALEQSSINSKNVDLVYEVINRFYKVTSRETIQTHDINSELQKGFNMNMKDTDRDHMIRLLNEGGNQPFDNKDQMLRAIGELCQQVKRLRNNMAM